jgi:hypothetical protein
MIDSDSRQEGDMEKQLRRMAAIFYVELIARFVQENYGRSTARGARRYLLRKWGIRA